MSKDLHLLAQGLSGFSHPTRLKILILMEREHSPSEVAELLPDEPLGVVAYHVRMLKQYGMVSEVRTEPRRGALEHFYKRTEFANILVGTLAELLGLPPVPKKPKGRQSDKAKARAADERELALLVAIGARAEEAAA